MSRERHELLKRELKLALCCTGPIGGCHCAAQAYTAAGCEARMPGVDHPAMGCANNQGVLADIADATIDFLGHMAPYTMVGSGRGLSRQIFEKRRIFPLMSFPERQKR